MPERPVTISGIRIIALAAVILGRWSVPGAHAAALFLGDFDALQSKQQLSHPDVPNWPTGDHLRPQSRCGGLRLNENGRTDFCEAQQR